MLLGEGLLWTTGSIQRNNSKKPIVYDMRWVDWEYIRENEEHYPGVYDSYKSCGVETFVGQKLTKWNDELIMQFYSTAHFYPDGRIVWMSEGTRYQSKQFCHLGRNEPWSRTA